MPETWLDRLHLRMPLVQITLTRREVDAILRALDLVDVLRAYRNARTERPSENLEESIAARLRAAL